MQFRANCKYSGAGMPTNNVIVTKSKAFALRVIKLYQYLKEEKKGICTVKTSASQWNEYWCKCERGNLCPK